MTIENAKEINAKLVNHGLADIVPVENPDDLQGISLSDMIEAKKVIDNQPEITVKNSDGTTSRTISMQCDDRLLAALYVVNNYQGGSLSEPNIVARSNGKILLIVDDIQS